MNAVIGMTELLMHEPLTERQRDYVNDINTSTQSLLSIINDILDLSKIESGKLSINPVNYDFDAMIYSVNSMFRYVAQNKGLEFRFETIGDMPKTVFGDDIRLKQVLTNLCGNAVKYTKEGYVRLKVTVTGDMLIFEIKDTGIGIQKEALPRLFHAFEQDKTDKNRSIVGSGLGLAISKAFVEMMDGKIMLDSEEDHGTVVTVMIPLVLGVESAIVREKKVMAELAMNAPDAKVLIVDDNEFNLKVAYGLLKLFCIDAKKAASGKAAIGMVVENDFDIVFMDHMMPEMDGVESTREIRMLGGKFRNLPIIALTANAVQGAKEMFLANGFNDFLSKPIEMQKLTEILMEWLPQEKIVQKSDAGESEDPDDVVKSDFWDALDEIGDINSTIGLSRVSGIESMYRDNLVLFQKKLLKDCAHLSACIDDLDIEKFSISIHAMKSVLATVGAMKLSESAQRLETASKNRDLIYCVDRFPYLKERLLYLHEALSAVFPEDEAASEKEPGDPDYLREYAQKALSAADDFDNDLGMEAVSSLLKYDFGAENYTILENALAAFRDYDYDLARCELEKVDVNRQ